MTSTLTAVSQTQSLAAIRNFVRASVSCIAYARGLCSDSAFESRKFLGLELKHMIPSTTESNTVSEWIEAGAFDALNRNYLKEMSLCVYTAQCTELLESYCFRFTYSPDNQRAQMSVTASPSADVAPVGTGSHASTHTQADLSQPPRKHRCSKEEVQEMLSSMLTKLIEVIESLPPLLGDRVLTMRLTYYDAVTPLSYEPPCFAPASDRMVRMYHEELRHNVLLGSMDSAHHVFSVSIRHPVLAQVRASFLQSNPKCLSGSCSDTPNSFLQSSAQPTSTTTAPTTAVAEAKQKKGSTDGCISSSRASHASARDSGEAAARKKRATDALGEALHVADVQSIASLHHLITLKEPLRLCEIAYLLLFAFVLTQAAPAVGGRGRLSLAELKRYLEETCPLGISSAAALAAMKQLSAEGVVHERHHSPQRKATRRQKEQDTQIAETGAAFAGGEAAGRHEASLPASHEWWLPETPSLLLVQGLLEQEQVTRLISANHLDILRQLAVTLRQCAPKGLRKTRISCATSRKRNKADT